MLSWWVIAILVVLIFVVIKYKELRHKFSFLVIVFLLLFLVLSFGKVYSEKKVDLTSLDGVISAGKLYFSWLGNAFANVKGLSGYAIKQDWGLPDNLDNTNITNTK